MKEVWMKRNLIWLLLGMGIMGGGRALADCLTVPTDPMPITVPGCITTLLNNSIRP
jgi:hypothetical protein